MSIESIEKQLQGLEAITNYPQVKQERDGLSQKVKELEASLEEAQKELSSFKELKAKFSDAQMTLEEARLDFTQSQEAEIERRTEEKFETLKADYQAMMPQLVYQRLMDILKERFWPKEIADVIKSKAQERADVMLRNPERWPQWFKELFQEEVKRGVSAGLNQEFDARVETAAMTRAQQRLNELRNTEWPAWYRATVEPKIVQLESKINANTLQLLKGPWVFICNQCGTSFDAELTANGIEQLLRTGQVETECANPDCVDKGWVSSQRHTFYVSLHKLIEIRITG